jgi:hypothetical protein
MPAHDPAHDSERTPTQLRQEDEGLRRDIAALEALRSVLLSLSDASTGLLGLLPRQSVFSQFDAEVLALKTDEALDEVRGKLQMAQARRQAIQESLRRAVEHSWHVGPFRP